MSNSPLSAAALFPSSRAQLQQTWPHLPPGFPKKRPSPVINIHYLISLGLLSTFFRKNYSVYLNYCYLLVPRSEPLSVSELKPPHPITHQVLTNHCSAL